MPRERKERFMRRIVLMLGLATGVWAGCSKNQAEPEVSGAREVLTEHRPLRAEMATKQMGEDCSENGASACLSGVCLHVKPGREEGYVCSRACQGEQECPQDWRCAQVYPTPQGRLCVPSPSRQ
ncbi:hypothetical protein DAT35_47120 [Vitiosangium sp. GDMCC 1.1324]|nr:hypothetical protein DAT35_47120 [Vitiosangium sp. GDMCC 1.1324]